MISLDEVRRLLGELGKDLSEDELVRLRGLAYLLAEEAVESVEREAQRKAA